MSQLENFKRLWIADAPGTQVSDGSGSSVH
jgi:hypothetical protein